MTEEEGDPMRIEEDGEVAILGGDVGGAVIRCFTEQYHYLIGTW